MSYKYFRSSKRKRAGDCAVRSLMVAEGLSWEEAFAKLCQEAINEQRMPNEIETIQKALKKMGYEPEKAPMMDLGYKNRRYRVWEFANENPRGTFILSLIGHLVCVKDGDWYDLFDSSDYKVFKVFRKVA